jgi:hypothetical protein
MGKLLHHRHNFLSASSGASEGIETLEAGQGVEDSDHLVKGWRFRVAKLFDESLDNDTQDFRRRSSRARITENSIVTPK